MVQSLIFAVVLITGFYIFIKHIKDLRKTIFLGRKIDRSDQKKERWKHMIRVALGQSKMVKRPIAGFLHILVYIGFIIINLEVLEIIVDGLLGTHRCFAFLGGFYDVLIGSFEILAVLVIIAVLLFWLRRNLVRIRRFWNPEMAGFPKNDANYILYFELVLMSLFLLMNAADFHLQGIDQVSNHYIKAGSFPKSSMITPMFESFSYDTVVLIERVAWWLHIVGILIFLNYLYYSKHLHIILAFPNTFYADLNPLGKVDNLESVKKEVELMMDPNADPFAVSDDTQPQEEPQRFGAKDVFDLNWVQLLNAYTCTECGRCTSSCPANQTGKLLSPRKIMMDTRDRLEEVSKNIRQNKGVFKDDGKTLLNDFISKEELWACTSCNACVEECPVSISPLSIIMDMRRYLVMEESAAPSELNNMMSNIENNGAPWPYNQMDRLNWKND